jgi:hypothetical protein
VLHTTDIEGSFPPSGEIVLTERTERSDRGGGGARLSARHTGYEAPHTAISQGGDTQQMWAAAPQQQVGVTCRDDIQISFLSCVHSVV